MSGWKKLAIISLCSSAGIVVALALLAGAIYRYSHRSRPRKDWPTIQLQPTGLRASFYTELRSGSVRYGFVVEPRSPELADDFAQVVNDSSVSKSFRVILRDAGGFELCGQDISNLTPGLESTGKISSAVNEGSLPCSESDYLEASTWDLRFTFPKLPLPKPEIAQAKKHRPDIFDQINPSKVESGDDKLVSFTFGTGRLVAESGLEFTVTSTGDRFLVLGKGRLGSPSGWPQSTPIHYECDSDGSCVVKDLWNGQIVSATVTHNSN